MKWIYTILILYFIGCAGVFLIQEQVIFDPRKVSESHRYPEGEEIEVPLNNDLSMNCLLLRNNYDRRGVILFLHGNRGTADRALFQIRRMAGGNGYDFFIPDYRGYGKTEGKPLSGRQLQNDADRAYQYLLQHYDEENIVVAGYSLGTGMASYVAAKNNPQTSRVVGAVHEPDCYEESVPLVRAFPVVEVPALQRPLSQGDEAVRSRSLTAPTIRSLIISLLKNWRGSIRNGSNC